MLYEIRATQGDEYTEWIIDAPAHRKGDVPGAVIHHAAYLTRDWAERGANMATPQVTIGQFVPPRVGYRDDVNRRTPMFVELVSFPLEVK